MKLNPIMALFEPLERLINEHGSAAILRDHVALFKDQLAILKEKFTNLETENQNLKTENAILKNKIQTYEKSLHDILLSETEVKILLFLAKQENIDITPEYVAQSLNINLQIITFHLQDLGAKKLVEDRQIAPFNFSLKRFWSLAQEGRRYLINHKLIS